MEPNRDLAPRNGYTFADPSGVTITGRGSWESLIANLTEFRKRGGFPPGDPKTEIYQQYCNQFHEACVGGTARAFQTLWTASGNFNNRVMNWLASIFSAVNRRQVGYVSNEEAQRRARICVACPRQAEFLKGADCKTCQADSVTLVKLLTQHRVQPGETPVLRGCNVLNEDTRASIHLDQPPVQRDGLPINCWRKL